MSGQFDEAARDIDYANNDNISDGTAQFYLLRSIAQALIGIGEYLERIDDALRNTIGGRP